MRTGQLKQLGSDWLRQVGRATVKAVAGAIALAFATFYVVHSRVEASIEIAVLFTVIVGIFGLIAALALTVGRQEAKLDSQAGDIRVTLEKVGVHVAIYAWVTNCETCLGDPSRAAHLTGDWKGAELRNLSENVISSIKPYPYYPAHFQDEIREITEDLERTSEERVEALLTRLRDNLAAGQYIR